jgi:hypothetical protein
MMTKFMTIVAALAIASGAMAQDAKHTYAFHLVAQNRSFSLTELRDVTATSAVPLPARGRCSDDPACELRVSTSGVATAPSTAAAEGIDFSIRTKDKTTATVTCLTRSCSVTSLSKSVTIRQGESAPIPAEGDLRIVAPADAVAPAQH